MQVTAGADMVDHVVDSARIAAENLEQQAPQLAGLVRNAAERAEEFSQDLRDQTVEDLIRMASDFTRKQPALVSVSPRWPVFNGRVASCSSSTERSTGAPNLVCVSI
jgi:hypothetical protein